VNFEGKRGAFVNEADVDIEDAAVQFRIGFEIRAGEKESKGKEHGSLLP
jgi:hypothetical protein